MSTFARGFNVRDWLPSALVLFGRISAMSESYQCVCTLSELGLEYGDFSFRFAEVVCLCICKYVPAFASTMQASGSCYFVCSEFFWWG